MPPATSATPRAPASAPPRARRWRNRSASAPTGSRSNRRPGSAPRLLIDGEPSAIGLSISHAGALSVAAFNPAGAVGIDLMEVQDVSDWARVAHDYLGMATRLPPGRDWRLPTGRWLSPRHGPNAKPSSSCSACRSPNGRLPGDCRLYALALPAGFAGALAI